MQYTLIQIDAFTPKLFGGNPAAVVPLKDWLEDDVLQALAIENNLSETAFVIPIEQDSFELRWFTPASEVALCGHATLATAHALFTGEAGDVSGDLIKFQTRHSGELMVRKRPGGQYEMNFPAYTTFEKPKQSIFSIGEMTGPVPKEVYNGQFLMAVYEEASAVREMKPDLRAVRDLVHQGHPGSLLVTAPGDGPYDFISRFFAPGLGISEDPVTGSAHCQLAPYWAQRLSKSELFAQQASARTGEISCLVESDRVKLIGQAVTYLRGAFELPA